MANRGYVVMSQQEMPGRSSLDFRSSLPGERDVGIRDISSSLCGCQGTPHETLLPRATSAAGKQKAMCSLHRAIGLVDIA
jgi:hypothetical protein